MRAFIRFLVISASVVIATSCSIKNDHEIISPNGQQKLIISTNQGKLNYSFISFGDAVVQNSSLGFGLDSKFEIVDLAESVFDTTWNPVYGQFNQIRNHYHQLKLIMEDTSGIKMNLYARVFDDGIGFRYEFPEQELDSVILIDYTTFAFSDNHIIWYKEQHDKWNEPERIHINDREIYDPPVTLEINDSLFVSIREAALKDCFRMLLSSTGANTLSCELNEEKMAIPYQSPWRTITAVQKPGDLIESSLILNLNDPPEDDFSWVKTGTAFWDWRVRGGTISGYKYCNDDLTTSCMKHFIDKAEELGIDYFTIDANWYGYEHDASSNPVTSKPKLDIQEVISYGNDRSIGVWLYINDIAFRNYDPEMILRTYREWGAKGIKHGFLQGDGVEKVQHAQNILKLCAKNKLLYVQHEGFNPAGIQRTYPNYFGVEVGYSQMDAKLREQINYLPEKILEEKRKIPEGRFAAEKIVPPSYHTINPFTTLLTGPNDFTPGVFDCNDAHKQGRLHFNSPLPSTINNQLALCNIIHSGVLHLMDAPESYEKYPEMFEFIVNLPISCDETHVIDAKIGDYLVIARRKGNEWFISGVTDEERRKLNITFDFLGDGLFSGKYYTADEDCSYLGEKEKFQIHEITDIDKTSEFTIRMVPGGGFNIWLQM